MVGFAALCRELTGMRFGELARLCAEDVLKLYSYSWFEALRRRKAGQEAGFPRRKRRLFPVRFRKRMFSVEGRRVRLATAKGSAELWVRLARDLPYPLESLRSVTLLCEASRLYLDVTAEVPVEEHGLEPAKIAGSDVGIIHPFAAVSGEDALLVSGRALRAEERLHLEDTKRRQKRAAARAPKRGQRGSRRWRRIRASQRRAESRHRRRVRQAHHSAAKEVVSWAVQRKVGTLIVGDPSGITEKDSGRRHNLRLRQWRRTHLLRCLQDKAERARMRVVMVDERGTSSTCPHCQSRVPKPKGRAFACPACGLTGHRDLVGARNIAVRGGGEASAAALLTHRRAGSPPARRDRRRHLYDLRRSCPDPGRPSGSRSPDDRPARISEVRT